MRKSVSGSVLVLPILSMLSCSAASERYSTVRDAAFATRAGGASEAGTSREAGDATGGAAGASAIVPRDVWGAATVLSLDEVLRVAEERNPTLGAAHASWQAAVERYPQVTALADPTLAYALAPGTIDSDQSIFGQKIDLAQRLPWPGKLSLRGDAALGDAEAAGDRFEDERQHLRHAVTEAYYTLWFSHRAIEINRSNQDVMAEFERIADRRYSAGLASKSDALQAEVELQHLVHRGIALERERAVAQARLNTLLNLPPKNPLPPPPGRVPLPGSIPDATLLEAVALDGRPELQSLGHSAEARAAEVDLAYREYFPDFGVNATYNSLWEEVEKQTIVGFFIDVPLQVERRRAAVREAEADHRRALRDLEEARAATLLSVSEAYDQLVETKHVVHLYSASILPAARESLQTARVGYEAGSNDFLTLLGSERALYVSELTYQEALAAYHQGRARLEFAVGRPLDELDRQGEAK